MFGGAFHVSTALPGIRGALGPLWWGQAVVGCLQMSEGPAVGMEKGVGCRGGMLDLGRPDQAGHKAKFCPGFLGPWRKTWSLLQMRVVTPGDDAIHPRQPFLK